MNILILGSGGREHAFAWKIKQSAKCNNLYIAPGNAGTGKVATNLDVKVNDFVQIAATIKDKSIDMLVVGPEVPLVEGITDYLRNVAELSELKIIGPTKAGALLEGSKEFAKAFMDRHNIPTAQSRSFTKSTIEDAMAYLQQQTPPIVLKADGLAAGKGVVICESVSEAEQSIRSMLIDEKFGEASAKVVVEEYLTGIELSVFVLTDGKSYKILPEAKDYKRIGENDSGPNTGGMGAISPVHFAHLGFLNKVEDQIIIPTINGLQKENIDYKGFIFLGLMNVEGSPYVIEYNVRMGDPETQAVLPRIKSDFVELLEATADQTLENTSLEIENKVAATVVMVSGGYPDSYEKGHTISGMASNDEKSILFHAGTANDDKGNTVNSGGRVLNITGFGSDMESALQNAYKRVANISWKDAYYRKDIGKDLIVISNVPD